jgi:hypothetical protein
MNDFPLYDDAAEVAVIASETSGGGTSGGPLTSALQSTTSSKLPQFLQEVCPIKGLDVLET